MNYNKEGRWNQWYRLNHEHLREDDYIGWVMCSQLINEARSTGEEMVFHDQQPDGGRQVLGERGGAVSIGVSHRSRGNRRERDEALPGLPHSQAQEQDDLAQNKLKRARTLGKDERN